MVDRVPWVVCCGASPLNLSSSFGAWRSRGRRAGNGGVRRCWSWIFWRRKFNMSTTSSDDSVTRAPCSPSSDARRGNEQRQRWRLRHFRCLIWCLHVYGLEGKNYSIWHLLATWCLNTQEKYGILVLFLWFTCISYKIKEEYTIQIRNNFIEWMYFIKVKITSHMSRNEIK